MSAQASASKQAPDELTVAKEQIAQLEADIVSLEAMRPCLRHDSTGLELENMITNLEWELKVLALRARVLEAGYEPFDSESSEDEMGWLEDPRPSRSRTRLVLRLLAFTALAVTGVGVGLLLTLQFSSAIVPWTIGGVVVATLAAWLIVGNQVVIRWEEKAKKALVAAGMPELSYAGLYALQKPMPPNVRTAVERARIAGLFETIRVWAPKEAFSKKARKKVGAACGVVVIFGETPNRDQFLIAEFNLGEGGVSSAPAGLVASAN
ncbi:MAG: hypothetical protein HYS52_00370 [Candidatus Wildermuthbacteria bacterium]|nr:hypothetical protein [Candidatus Wildermuthbacteria bacterium]